MISISVISCLVVTIVVIIYYEILYRLSIWIPRIRIRHRFRIVFGVFGGLVAHVVEIYVFAVVYYWMHQSAGWGYLQGNFNETLKAGLC